MHFKTRTNLRRIGSAIMLFFMAALLLSAKGPNEKEKIISVVNQFFVMMESRSVVDAKKILIPEGFSFSIREKEKGALLKTSSFKAFIDSLPDLKEHYKETMTNPRVLVHDRIAVLWAHYKFYRDGTFSHCGVDAFSLIKTDDGWKIAGVIYTVEKTGCE